MKKSQLGFNVTVHQNQVIGSFSMIGMSSVITKKTRVLPGYIFAGNPAKKISLNKIGMKKKNISKKDIKKELSRFNLLIKENSFL